MAGLGCRDDLCATSALMGVGYKDVVLITDGRFSGGTRGPWYRARRPGGCAVGGPIAFVQEGDLIAVDLFARRFDLVRSIQKVSSSRKDSWRPVARSLTGVLARYAKTVEQANLGAVQR